MDERLVRRIFSEVIAGYSLAKYESDYLFIKHFSSIDLLEFDVKYEEILRESAARGIPTEKEKIDILIKDKIWSREKEKWIENLKEGLESLYINKRKHFNPRDIESFNIQIKENEDALIKLLNERAALVGTTAETLARKRVNVDQILESFYRDSKLDEKVFSKKDIEDIDSDVLDRYYSVYLEFANRLSDKNIKRGALSGEFQNMYSMTESLYDFYGLPISRLTGYQSRLAMYANYYKNILSQENKPPQSVSNDPDSLEDWYFARNNVMKIIEKNESEGKPTSIVGMNRKDLEHLGIKVDAQSSNLKKVLKENGGMMDGKELAARGLI